MATYDTESMHFPLKGVFYSYDCLEYRNTESTYGIWYIIITQYQIQHDSKYKCLYYHDMQFKILSAIQVDKYSE